MRRLVLAPLAIVLSLSFSFPVPVWAAGAKPRVARKASLRTGLIVTHDDELVRAVKKKDRGALERLAERMGPGHLGEALHRPDAAVAEAALVALPLTRGAVLEIGAVTDLLESSNAALAAAAARVLGQLLDGAEPGALDDWEVPPDMVERACNGLRGLATRPEAAVTARVAAISAVASASLVCPAASGELAALLRDSVPAVRRATALVLRPEEKRANSALRDVVRDPERLVVSAAVATLCRDEPADGSGTGAPFKTDAPSGAVVEQARVMAPSRGTPAADAVEMLGCLARAATPLDKTILDQVRRGPASPLRDRAAELMNASDRLRTQ